MGTLTSQITTPTMTTTTITIITILQEYAVFIVTFIADGGITIPILPTYIGMTVVLPLGA